MKGELEMINGGRTLRPNKGQWNTTGTHVLLVRNKRFQKLKFVPCPFSMDQGRVLSTSETSLSCRGVSTEILKSFLSALHVNYALIPWHTDF